MGVSHFPSFPVPAPTPAEAVALAVASAYLPRADATAASLLLDHGPWIDHPDLLAALRDQMLAGAALCEGVPEFAEAADGSRPWDR